MARRAVERHGSPQERQGIALGHRDLSRLHEPGQRGSFSACRSGAGGVGFGGLEEAADRAEDLDRSAATSVPAR